LRCDAYRVNFANPRFTVVKIWAGEDAASYTQADVTPVSCGLAAREGWRFPQDDLHRRVQCGTAAAAGGVRLSGQLGAWTAGARDRELWRAGLAAGPLLDAGLERPFVHVGGGTPPLTCNSQVLVGGSIRLR